jgi:hypothetical protein
VSGALIEARAQGVEDVPGKLRLMAVAGPGTVSLTLSPDNARNLALWIERGIDADRVVRGANVARAEAEAAVARARQHVAEAELLGRLWAVLAVAACAAAGVILLLRA